MTHRHLLHLAVWACAILVAAPVGTAAASGPPSSQPRSPAATTLAQCLRTHDRLSVLVLVDQSGSLDETDPANLRVGGLGAALLGLKRLSERLGSSSKIEVLIAGFYYEVVTYPHGDGPPRWTEVNKDSIDGLLDEVRKFAELDRHKGRDTDYAEAMNRTRELFRQRTAELAKGDGGEPCKALIWFTDGRYHVQPRPPGDPRSAGLPRTTRYAKHIRLDRRDVKQDGDGNVVELVRFGTRVLCDTRRTMDDLVRDGVLKFTVALSDDSKNTKLTPADKDFLRALTTGGKGGRECGSLLSPRTGQYFDASSGSELLFELSSIPDPGPGPTPGPLCPEDPCPEGLSELPLVDGLGRFVITADTGRDDVEVVLVDPNRGEVRLRQGDPIRLEHSGARITQWWVTPRQVVIEGVLPADDPGWHGTWHLAFVRPPNQPSGSADHNVQLIADLVPELVARPQLTRGERTPVTFRLVRRGSQAPAANPLIAMANVTASITDSSGQTGPPVTPSGPDDQGTYTAEIEAPDATATTADFDVRVTFEESSGIAPIVQSFPLDVRLPEGYPLVSPDRLELPSITGEGSTSGTLRITGSETSGGCVWITEPKTDAPQDAGVVGFDVDPPANTPESCLAVKPGEAKTLRVTFTPASKADGSVQSVLPVHARSDDAQKDELTTVPVSYELYPRDIIDTFWRTVALLAVGTLLPLVILHVLNLFYARFPPEHRVKYLAQDVSYVPGRSFETSDGNPPDTGFGRFEWLSLETGSRKRALSVDVLDLRAVASGSWTDRRIRLFRGPYGVVTAKERTIIAGGSAPLKELRGGRAHEVPLGLAGTWIFVIDEIHRDDDLPVKVDGRVVLLIAADGDIDQGADLERRASAALASHSWPAPEQQPDEPAPPSRIDRLRERMRWRSRKEPAGTGWTDDDW